MKHFEGRLKVVSHIVLALEHEDPSQGHGIVGACGCEGSADQSHANALRLAACWNAMEGMEPGALEEAIRASDSVLRFHRYVGSFYNLGPNEAAEMREICAALSKALRRLRKEGV